MNKQKIERLLYTALIIIGCVVAFNAGHNDRKIKLCEESGNDTFFVTADGVEGCLVYHGEYCNNIVGGLTNVNDLQFTVDDFMVQYNDSS